MFGFSRWNDFIVSILGVWNKGFFFVISLVLTIAVFGLNQIDQVISEWVYEPSNQLWMVVAALIADWITRVGPIIGKKGFSTDKASRLPAKVLAHVGLLSGMYYMKSIFLATAGEGAMEIGTLMTAFAAFYLTSVTGLSAVRNAAAAGWLPKKAADILMEYIDQHKKVYFNITKQKKETDES